jgi:hypothetical protein
MTFVRLFISMVVALVFAGEAVAGEAMSFAKLAKSSGTPKIPGVHMIYFVPLGNPAEAPFRNIIIHQTETPPGVVRRLAREQADDPTKRGVTIWVETDGTAYWATPENIATLHGDGGNRNDNKYIDNSKTYRHVYGANSIGVEFNGNYPDVAASPTPEQFAVALHLAKFLQERYGIPIHRVYAHNWIDHKDYRYCEGCELAKRIRAQDYVPSSIEPLAASGVTSAVPPVGR